MCLPFRIARRSRPGLVREFAFSMMMLANGQRMGHMEVINQYKNEAMQCAMELLAWPEKDEDESMPSCSSSDTDETQIYEGGSDGDGYSTGSDVVLWGDES